ncbi:uncharacterized protein C8Q71DRAFT_856718 [Rhodofomes roseus]|uniref:Uncharacterized protein n=1 Tax=Rhodofomes roseus TaxID=34475 RepID=A0ABQ8KLH4_9APHY|nr:uncharacterized protein C8Q71DRAFT_856718 [Rhodofomes roseus]KAH9838798.1 hypothetical protein C8Q71DRAFT_856718 [Rhodofomes roseus]
MRSALLTAAFATVFALAAHGQTITTTNALGLTVVEAVTLNPLGIPTTEVLSTLTGDTDPATDTATDTATTTSHTATARTTASTTTTQNPGAVEDSPTEAGASQTVYYYSTTNAAGATIVQEATFTPTFAPTTTLTPTATGTILQYSEWHTSAGTAAASSAAPLLDISWLFGPFVTIVAMLGGGVLVMA